MSWSRFDDLWSEKIEESFVLDFGARWHYMALIQLCSRLDARDGILSRTKAERCSDHPDPHEAMNKLVEVGLVANLGNRIRVIRASEHVISEAKVEELERNRNNQKRSRAHREGDHQHCAPGDGDKPSNCSKAPTASSDSHSDTSFGDPHEQREEPIQDSDSHSDVTDDVGKGRAVTGKYPPQVKESVDPETGELDSAPPSDHSTSSPYPFPEAHPILDAAGESQVEDLTPHILQRLRERNAV